MAPIYMPLQLPWRWEWFATIITYIYFLPILWTCFSCDVNFCLLLICLLQKLHVYGVSVEWTILCLLSSPLFHVLNWQVLQKYLSGFCSMCVIECFFSSPLLHVLYSQMLHLYFFKTFSSWIFVCWLKFEDLLKLFWQILQIKSLSNSAFCPFSPISIINKWLFKTSVSVYLFLLKTNLKIENSSA